MIIGLYTATGTADAHPSIRHGKQKGARGCARVCTRVGDAWLASRKHFRGLLEIVSCPFRLKVDVDHQAGEFLGITNLLLLSFEQHNAIHTCLPFRFKGAVS